jgi:hypothetical protein
VFTTKEAMMKFGPDDDDLEPPRVITPPRRESPIVKLFVDEYLYGIPWKPDEIFEEDLTDSQPPQ